MDEEDGVDSKRAHPSRSVPVSLKYLDRASIVTAGSQRAPRSSGGCGSLG